MTAPAPQPEAGPTFDKPAIREHAMMIHQLAAGLSGKFVVSTFFANPNGEDRAGGVISHHPVGDVDGTVDAIMAHAGTPNANVYLCPNLMRSSLDRGKKGSESDVVAVLALVADMDDDTGRSGSMPVEPNYVVESSPGNYQCFVLLESAMQVPEAKALASALKRGANADHCTIDTAHVWRVPGTFNWPNAKKLARGRSPDPVAVRVAEPWRGELSAIADLERDLSPWAGETVGAISVEVGSLPDVSNVTISSTAQAMLAADDVGDRSGHAARVIEQLAYDGLIVEEACAAFLSATGNWFARYDGKDPVADFTRIWGKFGAPHAEEAARSIQLGAGLVARYAAKARPIAANDNVPSAEIARPIDPWAQRRNPTLPLGVLPALIEDFSLSQSQIMGVDPGGLAAAAIAVCSAATPDSITLRMKRYDDWEESARIWVALVGNPSAKKSPIISAATRPLRAMDDELVRVYLAEKRKFDALDKAGKAEAHAPMQIRTRIEDVTPEAVQEIMKDTHEGVLLIRDELSGWFGSMERYGTGKGASADRSFWLQAFNGGGYSVNRVGRGVVSIPNLSVSMLGGIQPDAIRKIAADSVDDGLLQRLFPICIGTASVGADVPPSTAVQEYGGLVRRLHQLKRPRLGGMNDVPLKFDAAGQDLRFELEEKHHDLAAGWEIINKKLASHIGKFDGLFGRLCVVFHCIDSKGNSPAHVVPYETAKRAASFLHEFLFPHSLAFYGNVLGMTDRHDALLATAGWILTHRPEKVTVRDVRRGDKVMREMDVDDAEGILRKLDAMRWLDPLQSTRRDSIAYVVNPAVYEDFSARAENEKTRRERVRDLIASS